MNRHLLGKNLHVFLQNSTFFIQILMIILKINVTLKSFLVMQFFNYCLNQIFLAIFFALKQFHQMTVATISSDSSKGEIQASNKIQITLDFTSKHIYKMMFLQIQFEVALQKVTSHSYAMIIKRYCAVFHLSFYNNICCYSPGASRTCLIHII